MLQDVRQQLALPVHTVVVVVVEPLLPLTLDAWSCSAPAPWKGEYNARLAPFLSWPLSDCEECGFCARHLPSLASLRNYVLTPYAMYMQLATDCSFPRTHHVPHTTSATLVPLRQLHGRRVRVGYVSDICNTCQRKYLTST